MHVPQVPRSENPDQIGTNSEGPINVRAETKQDQGWAGFTTFS